MRDVAQGFVADVIMISETWRNGTERCAAALANATFDSNLIVNF
jgi:CMP-2-keto-3-deoxyoctulosonic acid synthetase